MNVTPGLGNLAFERVQIAVSVRCKLFLITKVQVTFRKSREREVALLYMRKARLVAYTQLRALPRETQG